MNLKGYFNNFFLLFECKYFSFTSILFALYSLNDSIVYLNSTKSTERARKSAEKAKAFGETGVTGAYEKEFKIIENMLDQVESEYDPSAEEDLKKFVDTIRLDEGSLCNQLSYMFNS